jgi:hypothetical protein
MSCDQAILVDQATDASLSSDAVQVEIGRLGSGFSGAAPCKDLCGQGVNVLCPQRQQLLGSAGL